MRRIEATSTADKAGGPWTPYAPNETSPWNLKRVVHLHRRAGFAATWDELQRDLKDGPEASVCRLLSGHARIGVPEDFERTAGALADAAASSRDPVRLKAAWIYRMLTGPDPLGERLTLMWHDHFATSNVKVDDLPAMRRQNDCFRQHARGPFGELLNATMRDPALLTWLDATANRKGHPNENLGRELLELFALGIGHYTEADVKEAARALTGWTVRGGEFYQAEKSHDPGQKTILGRTGHWRGSDLVRILLDAPATAERLAWRLCNLLLGEQGVDAAGIQSLAQGLRKRDLDIGWGVSTVLRSRAFFDESNLRTRIVGPVEHVVGSARALGLLDPCPDTLILAEWAARLGQDLFYPPNVGGWQGGRSWLTTRSLIGRANYAVALADGRSLGLAGPPDLIGLAARFGRGDSLDALVRFVAELLLGGEPSTAWHSRIVDAAGQGTASRAVAARSALALILASPEAQLG